MINGKDVFVCGGAPASMRRGPIVPTWSYGIVTRSVSCARRIRRMIICSTCRRYTNSQVMESSRLSSGLTGVVIGVAVGEPLSVVGSGDGVVEAVSVGSMVGVGVDVAVSVGMGVSVGAGAGGAMLTGTAVRSCITCT